MALAAAIGVSTQVGVVGLALLTAVVVRAYDSAKGPLPPALLTPVPSPMGGDLSGIVVILWEADALLLAASAAAVVCALIFHGITSWALLGAAALNTVGFQRCEALQRAPAQLAVCVEGTEYHPRCKTS